MLKNVLMKAYYDAGLESIAKAAGYPVQQIKICGQFKRTHNFILEVWYGAMVDKFMEEQDTQVSHHNGQTNIALPDTIIKNLTESDTPRKNFSRSFNEKLRIIQTEIENIQ